MDPGGQSSREHFRPVPPHLSERHGTGTRCDDLRSALLRYNNIRLQHAGILEIGCVRRRSPALCVRP